MNKRITLLVMLVCLLGFGGQAFAELCTIDAVPAATLLLPAFQVDISAAAAGGGQLKCGDGTGITTLFSVNNASAAPALVHATLWTDWSWPTLDFDIYLTGFDVQTVNLCDVFKGNLPVTADSPRDAADTISRHAGTVTPGSPDNPRWDDVGLMPDIAGAHPGHTNETGFTNCANVLPFTNPALNTGLINRLTNAHAGFPVPGIGATAPDACAAGACCTGQQLNGAGSCSAGVCPAGSIARGYITLDSVSACSTLFPSDANYFVQGGTGTANNNNMLWGDWFFIDDGNAFAQGDVLVSIEAHNAMTSTTIPKSTPRRFQTDPNRDNNVLFGEDPAAAVSVVANPHGYTYYGRYTTVVNGADNREPLGTSWGARYIGAFSGGTTYVAWRDSTQITHNTAYNCGLCGAGGAGPPWCPLNEQQVVCWDEAEDVRELCFQQGGGVVSPPDPSQDPACFPLEVNFTAVGTAPLNPPWPNGWCFMNLNHPTLNAAGNMPFNGLAQSYVTAVTSALGQFSVGLQAHQFTTACQAVANGGAEPRIKANNGID